MDHPYASVPQDVTLNEERRLVRLNADLEILDLSEGSGITYVTKTAFEGHHPRWIRCDDPYRLDLRAFCGPWVTGVQLTPEAVHVSLFQWYSALETITFCGEHPLYKAIDGVVYSKNGDTLLAYPRQKPDKVFRIPEGVKTIGEGAFNEQACLEYLWMPDTVEEIHQGAFSHCVQLQEVRLSENLTTLVDSEDGVFESCRRLCRVSFGRKLRSIGNRAFYGCECMKEFTLPEGLLRLGINSLEYVRGSLSLPRSLLWAEKYSLNSVSELTVYEGSCKGLMYALYKPVTLHVIRRDGSTVTFCFSKKDLTYDQEVLLGEAWDSDELNLAEVEAILEAEEEMINLLRKDLY